MADVPRIRIHGANSRPVNEGGEFVLYWMTAFRRVSWNFSLERAVEWAVELGKPLVVLETLSCGQRWDSDRLHRFVLEGMADNGKRLREAAALYYPYVGRSVKAATDLVGALSNRACVIVTDEYPMQNVPQMVGSAARRVRVLMEQVDSNGMLPLRAAERVFATAYSFRRFLQQVLPAHLVELPDRNPLRRARLRRLRALPGDILKRWPKAGDELLSGHGGALGALPIDHSVTASKTRGGGNAAEAALRRFVRNRLAPYAEARNEPEREATSGLAPYLHCGHMSAHEVFAAVMRRERWSVRRLSTRATGSRSGWWGVSESAEAFLDQLITWRELGYNMCWQRDDYDQYQSLPDWAKDTLAKHRKDPKPYVYPFEEFEKAETHDRLWNAAQMQLVREGRLHNYLRMLWGKKILEWSESPQDALNVMIELNNKYGLDGQDPNSYSGIFWVLGRYDRPWGPERPIFGKVRYMSSENTARKVRVVDYVRKYHP